jgi:hypothetical protein
MPAMYFLKACMRTVIGLFSLVLLTGCSVVPPQAWTFDPTQPQARPVLATPEVVALTDRTAQLQSERNAIRARIANEPDARKRLPMYESLHRVGMELSPLERRLASTAAGR